MYMTRMVHQEHSEEFQTEIQKLEAYYASQQWKDDFAMDEKGDLRIREMIFMENRYFYGK